MVYSNTIELDLYHIVSLILHRIPHQYIVIFIEFQLSFENASTRTLFIIPFFPLPSGCILSPNSTLVYETSSAKRKRECAVFTRQMVAKTNQDKQGVGELTLKGFKRLMRGRFGNIVSGWRWGHFLSFFCMMDYSNWLVVISSIWIKSCI
jgi:hypothetical protein